MAAPQETIRKRGGRGVGAAIVGGLFGLLGGIGGGFYLQQDAVLDPTSKSSLAIPAVGLLIGVAAGLFGGRRPRQVPRRAP